jgi:glycosyltransferase involved in cell wall biosynthesis
VSLRILFTNNALAARGGTELYVRDVAMGLLKRGHTPLVYSSSLGEVAAELQAANVLVVDDLNRIDETPDLIHGHHHLDTMTALLHFPRVPAINFCHGWSNWYETPVRFPRVVRYVAVDQACRDRLVNRHGIAEASVRVLLNFVDLARFKMRAAPLPPRPRRALLFSNYANEETHLPVVREACQQTNLELDVVGSGRQNANAEPEKILSQYDLVFAKARCALEALAVGSAVVLCDAGGVGPMVTTAELDQLRPLNFGIRTLRGPLDTGTLVREINRYDSRDAAEVCRRIRADASLDFVLEELIGLYHEVIEEFAHSSIDADEEGRAAAAYLRELKLDFAKHGAASMRLQEKMRNIPIVGRWGIKLVRKLVP